MVGRRNVLEELTPIDVINHAINVRTPITLTITGTVDGYEVDSEGAVTITIAGREIDLHDPIRYVSGYRPDPRVVVTREATQ